LWQKYHKEKRKYQLQDVESNYKNHDQTSLGITCLCLPGRSMSGASLHDRILPNASNTLHITCVSTFHHKQNSILIMQCIISNKIKKWFCEDYFVLAAYAFGIVITTITTTILMVPHHYHPMTSRYHLCSH